MTNPGATNDSSKLAEVVAANVTNMLTEGRDAQLIAARIGMPLGDPAITAYLTGELPKEELVKIMGARAQNRIQELISEGTGASLSSLNQTIKGLETYGYQTQYPSEYLEGKITPLCEEQLLRYGHTVTPHVRLSDTGKEIKETHIVNHKLEGAINLGDSGKHVIVPIIAGKVITEIDGQEIINCHSITQHDGKISGAVMLATSATQHYRYGRFVNNPEAKEAKAPAFMPLVDGKIVTHLDGAAIIECKSISVKNGTFSGVVTLDGEMKPTVFVVAGKSITEIDGYELRHVLNGSIDKGVINGLVVVSKVGSEELVIREIKDGKVVDTGGTTMIPINEKNPHLMKYLCEHSEVLAATMKVDYLSRIRTFEDKLADQINGAKVHAMYGAEGTLQKLFEKTSIAGSVTTIIAAGAWLVGSSPWVIAPLAIAGLGVLYASNALNKKLPPIPEHRSQINSTDILALRDVGRGNEVLEQFIAHSQNQTLIRIAASVLYPKTYVYTTSVVEGSKLEQFGKIHGGQTIVNDSYRPILAFENLGGDAVKPAIAEKILGKSSNDNQ